MTRDEKLDNYYQKLEQVLSELKTLIVLDEKGAARRIICPLDDGSKCTIISACDPDGIVSHTFWFWSEEDDI